VDHIGDIADSLVIGIPRSHWRRLDSSVAGYRRDHSDFQPDLWPARSLKSGTSQYREDCLCGEPINHCFAENISLEFERETSIKRTSTSGPFIFTSGPRRYPVGTGPRPSGSIRKDELIMSQQNRFGVARAAREEPRDTSFNSLQRPTTVRARVLESNERYSLTRALDLTDKSQRVAQTMHLGKTIDDIPL
jgi:hypothetical protein